MGLLLLLTLMGLTMTCLGAILTISPLMVAGIVLAVVAYTALACTWLDQRKEPR